MGRKIYSPFLDRSIQVPTRAKFHDLTPMLCLVLHEINSLDDVWMVQRRGDTEFCSEFLDVFFLRLVLATFPEFLVIIININQRTDNIY
jgi:hypothetical protein